MRGSLTFKITPDQQIQCVGDLYEMTELDLLRISAALQEKAFGLQVSLIQKALQEADSKRVIQEAADFKKIDGQTG